MQNSTFKKISMRKVYTSTVRVKQQQILGIFNKIIMYLLKKKNRAFQKYRQREKFIF